MSFFLLSIFGKCTINFNVKSFGDLVEELFYENPVPI